MIIFSQKYVSCMGRSIPWGHGNKFSRLTVSFMIIKAQMKLKNKLLFLRLQLSALCRKK